MIDLGCGLLIAFPIVVLLVAVLLLPGYLNKQNAKVYDLLKSNQEAALARWDAERKKSIDKTRLNVTLQAYERMILFVERINPPALLMRVMIPRQSAGQLHTILLNNIREEYEHNMSQQLYVTDKAWEMVVAGKEEILNLINNSASKIKEDESAKGLAKIILTANITADTHPIKKALTTLKSEMLKNFD